MNFHLWKYDNKNDSKRTNNTNSFTYTAFVKYTCHENSSLVLCYFIFWGKLKDTEIGIVRSNKKTIMLWYISTEMSTAQGWKTIFSMWNFTSDNWCSCLFTLQSKEKEMANKIFNLNLKFNRHSSNAIIVDDFICLFQFLRSRHGTKWREWRSYSS